MAVHGTRPAERDQRESADGVAGNSPARLETLNHERPGLIRAAFFLSAILLLLDAGCAQKDSVPLAQPGASGFVTDSDHAAGTSEADGSATDTSADPIRVLGLVRWDTGRPLCRALIRLGEGGDLRETTGDEEGRFEYIGLSSGEYRILAGSSRGTAFVEKRLLVREGDNEIVLVVPDPSILEFVIKDESGSPVRARVLPWNLDFPWRPTGSRGVRHSGDDGRVVLDELQVATTQNPVLFNGMAQAGYKIVVGADGYLTETLVVEAPAGGKIVPVTLRKEPPPVRISVHLTDKSGEPVGGARIECNYTRETAESRWWAESKSASDGTLEIDIRHQRLVWAKDGKLVGTISLRVVHDDLGEAKQELPPIRASETVTLEPIRVPGVEEGK